jgi:hypothetical protein
MSVGQLLSDTFGMVKARFGGLVGLWAVYLAMIIALVILFAVVVGTAGIAGLGALGEGNVSAIAGGGFVVGAIVFYVGYFLVVMAQYASLVTMASPLRQPSFGDAFGTGWRSAPALLLLIIVMMIAYLVLAIPFGLLAAALASLGAARRALTLLIALGVMLWVGSRLAPLFAIIAVDGVRNPFTALARSWRLTSGHALTIFLTLLSFLVIMIVVCGIALIPSFGLLRTMADPSGLGSAGAALGGVGLLMLTFVVLGVVFTVSYAALLAVIHGSLSNAAGEGVVEAFA